MDQHQNPGTGSNLFQLNLDGQNSYTLRSVASWAKVLGIVSIICAILFIAGGILFQQNASKLVVDSDYRRSGLTASSLGNMGLIMYVIMGAIFGLSGMFAVNAGSKIRVGLNTNNMEALNSGFAGARNFFALWAILVILMLLLFLITILAALGSS